jgi:hypothetical protein
MGDAQQRQRRRRLGRRETTERAAWRKVNGERAAWFPPGGIRGARVRRARLTDRRSTITRRWHHRATARKVGFPLPRARRSRRGKKRQPPPTARVRRARLTEARGRIPRQVNKDDGHPQLPRYIHSCGGADGANSPIGCEHSCGSGRPPAMTRRGTAVAGSYATCHGGVV